MRAATTPRRYRKIDAPVSRRLKRAETPFFYARTVPGNGAWARKKIAIFAVAPMKGDMLNQTSSEDFL
jgi:hypothetical protein